MAEEGSSRFIQIHIIHFNYFAYVFVIIEETIYNQKIFSLISYCICIIKLVHKLHFKLKVGFLNLQCTIQIYTFAIYCNLQYKVNKITFLIHIIYNNKKMTCTNFDQESSRLQKVFKFTIYNSNQKSKIKIKQKI